MLNQLYYKYYYIKLTGVKRREWWVAWGCWDDDYD